jgi:hypothetical protein
MRMRKRYCPVHDSLGNDVDDHCRVRELSLVHDECRMVTVLMAATSEAKRMQKYLDAYLPAEVRSADE